MFMFRVISMFAGQRVSHEGSSDKVGATENYRYLSWTRIKGWIPSICFGLASGMDVIRSYQRLHSTKATGMSVVDITHLLLLSAFDSLAYHNRLCAPNPCISGNKEPDVCYAIRAAR